MGSFIACGLYGLCAFFQPGWSFVAMFAVLVASGFFMSFQFTAYNTIAYDQIAPEKLSSATAFYTTFQQLMLSVGICVAAMGLEGRWWREAVRRRGWRISPSPGCCSAVSQLWRYSGMSASRTATASSSAATRRAPGRCARPCATCAA